MVAAASEIAQRRAALKVLIVDDEHTMRKVARSLLLAIGVRTVYEVSDGHPGLEAIRTFLPAVAKPRRFAKMGDYYGPEPRQFSSYKPEDEAAVAWTACAPINETLTTSAGALASALPTCKAAML